jgi:hypothetical protein
VSTPAVTAAMLITVSIGLSNARLNWNFVLSGAQLRQFEVIRAYYAWEPKLGEFRRGVTSHERSAKYTFNGGKMITEIPSDNADLADDKWTENRIGKVLDLAKSYLESGQRDTFENRIEDLIK